MFNINILLNFYILATALLTRPPKYAHWRCLNRRLLGTLTSIHFIREVTNISQIMFLMDMHEKDYYLCTRMKNLFFDIYVCFNIYSATLS